MFTTEAQRHRDTEKTKKIKIPGLVPSSMQPLRFTVTWTAGIGL
jgi:hypothetical protein